MSLIVVILLKRYPPRWDRRMQCVLSMNLDISCSRWRVKKTNPVCGIVKAGLSMKGRRGWYIEWLGFFIAGEN
ncbi:hypothetical protein KY285_029669 [Solanum tuberosum]|nr:hypothetical protein KY289_029838 [Solanum tuberosum]KAH0654787.1 hypothetical protein KY285_029669 [Solanum tuberosum]